MNARRSYAPVLVGVVLALFFAPPALAAPNLLCGPNCMMSVCQKLGIALDLEEMKTLCGYDENGGVTLLGLQTAARAVGIQAVGMKIGLDQLAGFKGPAIAHLWG
ncbi:MAG: hypothetical protein GX141_04740, partial [Armatimonadetes bacterium]|nr:hypothetical protein [Armatimonadota bacterium]